MKATGGVYSDSGLAHPKMIMPATEPNVRLVGTLVHANEALIHAAAGDTGAGISSAGGDMIKPKPYQSLHSGRPPSTQTRDSQCWL
jgi:hypothetical protein